MIGFGRCLGYTGTTCPSCGRYRVEMFEIGHTVCEKCQWSPSLGRYSDDDEIFGEEEDWHLEEVKEDE